MTDSANDNTTADEETSAAAQALINFLDKMRPQHPLEGEGWKYIDPPGKFSPEMWEQFLSQFGGAENYRMLAQSSGTGPNGPWRRGQLLVSPAGMEAFKASVAKIREERDSV